MSNFLESNFNESIKTLQSFLDIESNLVNLSHAIGECSQALKNGGKIMSCGNGGSMCDAMHFAEELTGRFRKDRKPLAGLSLSDPSHMSCVSNDYGYEFIFSRMVEAFGKKGDLLLAISTSGNSKNVLLAAEKAKELGVKIIGLVGKDGGALKEVSDFPLIVPHKITDRVQEVHIKIIHNLIEGIERELFPDHYS